VKKNKQLTHRTLWHARPPGDAPGEILVWAGWNWLSGRLRFSYDNRKVSMVDENPENYNQLLLFNARTR